MAQGKIIVETSAVIGVAKNIETLVQNYHDAYTELYKIVDSMGQAQDWHGADHDAYVRQIKAFENDFQAMEELMRAYADFLQKAMDGYKTIQSHTVDSVSKNLQASAN